MARNGGFSLIEIMITLTVLTVISLGLVRLLSSSTQSARSTERLVDLKFLARNFSENVECHTTLGTAPIGSAGFTPLSCTSYSTMGSVTLRRKDGSAFPSKIGGFDIRAGCRDGALRIEAMKPDPMLKQKIFVDVFGGTGELCRHYFAAGNVCPPGQTLIGSAGGVPVCGANTLSSMGFEKVSTTTTSTPSVPCAWTDPSSPQAMKHVVGEACCPAGKVPIGGGGRCNTGAGGFTEISIPQGNCWYLDCCKYYPHEPADVFVNCVKP